MSDDDFPVPESSGPELSTRRRRLLFRAHHRGTKETDLMVGGFVTRHITVFTDADLDELETVLEMLDVDLADWLSGRRPVPAEVMTPMLARMAEECSMLGAGVPPDIHKVGDINKTAGDIDKAGDSHKA